MKASMRARGLAGGASPLALALVLGAVPSVATAQAAQPTGTADQASSSQPANSEQQSTGDQTAVTPSAPAVPQGAPATASGTQANPSTAPAPDASAATQTGAQTPGDVTTGAGGAQIVVTGLRQSLATAQAIKQNSEQFVDSVTAQDIGRLPDTNIAEALQRISGVQITRTYGEGTGVAIRGLTQVRTELNGRDIFSANGGRGLSFEELGPDLLAGLDVYKNPSAELIEGSLGGTVNLRTRMPFDAPGPVVSVTGALTRYDLIDKFGGDVSGLVSDRWQTGIGEIGLLANVSWARTSFREDDVVVEPYHEHGPNPDNDPTIQSPVPGYETEDVLVPHGGGFSDTFGNRRRFSTALAAQWKPADNLQVYAQFLNAKYHFADRGVSYFAYGDSATPTAGSTYKLDSNNVATSGELHDLDVDSVSFGTDRKTSTSDYSAGAKWDITSRLHLSVDYQHIHSTADQDTINLTISALNPVLDGPLDYSTNPPTVEPRGQDWNLVFDTSGKIPTLQSDVPGYFDNLNNYGFTAILPYAEKNQADSDAARADLAWDFDDGSFLKKISAGFRYSDKSAINRNTTYGTWTAVGSSCANWSGDSSCFLVSDFPQYAEHNPFQSDLLRGKAADRDFGPVYEWALADATDPSKAFAAVKDISGQDIAFRSFDDPNAFNGTINEKDYAGYLRIAFGSRIFGLDWDGNAGIRWTKTDESGQGFEVLSYRQPGTGSANPSDPNAPQPTTVNIKNAYGGNSNYVKWLPSLNLRLHFTPQLQARFAVSKNFYRPDFTQLNPSFNLSPTYNQNNVEKRNDVPDTLNPALPYNAQTNPYVGTGTVAGNPNLKPERVTSIDTALEYYFSRVGYVYGTVFYKKLHDIIDTRNTIDDFDVPDVGTVQFNVSEVVNVSKGYAKGFEVGGQKFFDFLPGALSGLGVEANYTYVKSSAGAEAAGAINSPTLIAVPLIGLSEHSYNLIALYDKYGINLRVAYNWRGKYLQSTSNTGTQNLPIFGRPAGYLDASASYDINKHMSVTIDAQNILNTAFRTYQITEEFPRDYEIDDRRITGRFRIRF